MQLRPVQPLVAAVRRLARQGNGQGALVVVRAGGGNQARGAGLAALEGGQPAIRQGEDAQGRGQSVDGPGQSLRRRPAALDQGVVQGQQVE